RIKALTQQQGSFNHLLKGGSRHRVEIEMQIVRPIHIITARVPLVKIDATEIDYPKQRSQILNHREVDHVPRRMLNMTEFDPIRTRRGRPLHKEKITRRAV